MGFAPENESIIPHLAHIILLNNNDPRRKPTGITRLILIVSDSSVPHLRKIIIFSCPREETLFSTPICFSKLCYPEEPLFLWPRFGFCSLCSFVSVFMAIPFFCPYCSRILGRCLHYCLSMSGDDGLGWCFQSVVSFWAFGIRRYCIPFCIFLHISTLIWYFIAWGSPLSTEPRLNRFRSMFLGVANPTCTKFMAEKSLTLLCCCHLLLLFRLPPCIRFKGWIFLKPH